MPKSVSIVGFLNESVRSASWTFNQEPSQDAEFGYMVNLVGGDLASPARVAKKNRNVDIYIDI